MCHVLKIKVRTTRESWFFPPNGFQSLNSTHQAQQGPLLLKYLRSLIIFSRISYSSVSFMKRLAPFYEDQGKYYQEFEKQGKEAINLFSCQEKGNIEREDILPCFFSLRAVSILNRGRQAAEQWEIRSMVGKGVKQILRRIKRKRCQGSITSIQVLKEKQIEKFTQKSQAERDQRDGQAESYCSCRGPELDPQHP